LADIVVSDDGVTLLDVIRHNNTAEAFAGATTEGAFAANEFSQQARTLSLYSHNTFAVNDQWDMVFGFRWIDDKKDGKFAQRDNESQACLNTLGKVGAGLLPSNFGWFAAGFICIPFIAPADVPGTFLPQSFAQTFNDEVLTYTAKSVFHINKDSSTYASFTHGYKAGGFSLDPTAAVAGTDPTSASETTDAWEIGYKADQCT
jgi:iron complex outermembrane receptor protein